MVKYEQITLFDEFLVFLGPIISRLFTCSNEEKNKKIKQRALALVLSLWRRRKKSFSANRRQIRISSEAASNSANDLCLNTTGITVAIAMFILIQVSNVIKLFTAVSYDFS
jgi:hypothetical protein